MDVGDTLSYSIITGNMGGIFAIDDTTGVIKIADNTHLDYEAATGHVLTIQIRDV